VKVALAELVAALAAVPVADAYRNPTPGSVLVLGAAGAPIGAAPSRRRRLRS